jgi:CheY-like chemotaxis protein
MFGFNTKSLADLKLRRELKDQIHRSRILVIDDQKNAFPTELLQQEGYNITYWECVKTLAPLENGDFDIIILDLNGIATPEQSGKDGVGILRHIKSYNPSQIVIAYSAKKYDFKEGDFWKLADDFLGKPSPLIACKQKIDELLQTKFNVEHYWSILRGRMLAESVSEKNIKKLENLIVTKSNKNQHISADELSGIIKISKESLSAAFVIITIIGKILAKDV